MQTVKHFYSGTRFKMGTKHQLTVGRLLKAIQRLKRQKKISNNTKIVGGDIGGIAAGKICSCYEFGNELNIDFRETE
jgi:hypothetical protein